MENIKQNEFEMPPPYSAYSSVGESVPPNMGFVTSQSVVASPLDKLTQVLGHHEQLVFFSADRINLGASAVVVQLQDLLGHAVLSTIHSPGANVSQGVGDDHTIRVGSTTRFMDTTGRALLTSQETGRSVAVSSGDMTLGVLEGFSLFSSQNVVAKNVLGVVVLRVVQGSTLNHGKEFKFFLGNETEVGKIEKNQQGQVILSFSHNLDPQTKGLLLATSYIIYLHHFATTIFGEGQISLFKKLCCCGIGMLFVPILIFLIVYFAAIR